MKVLCCVIACIVLVSCSAKKVPSNILPPDKMGMVLWDQMEADAFTQDFLSKDSTKNLKQENFILQEKIFQKYHTDQKTYYRSYSWYTDHGSVMKDMLDSVSAKKSREREKERLQNLLKKKKLDE